MKLLWHLIRKDLVALRLWLLVWLAALATHFTLRAIQFAHGEAALPERFAISNRPDYLALLLLIALIVPQVLQLDPPARAGAFWKMLPISRWRVLLAKLVLIGACFIVLPACFEAAYFTTAGFGSWTWRAVESWLWNTAPLVLIVAGAAALAQDLRIAALLIGAAVLALLPGGAGNLNRIIAPFGFAPGFPNFGQSSALVMTPLGWLLVIGGLVMLPWQYLARGRFGWVMAAAVVGIPWALGFAAPRRVPEVKPEGVPSVEGLRLEVEPWQTEFNRTETSKHAEMIAVVVRMRVAGVPAGMEIETISMSDPRLIRSDRTVTPPPPGGGRTSAMPAYYRAQDWLRNRNSPAQKRDGLYTVPSSYFEMSGEELAAAPTAFESKVQVQLKQVHKLSEAPLQPGVYWRDGLHYAEVVSAGLDKDGAFRIQQRAESKLVDPTGRSAGPYPAGMLNVRLHQVPWDWWIELATIRPGLGFTTGMFGAAGEASSVQSRSDHTRSLAEEISGYRLDIEQLISNTQLTPLAAARLRDAVSAPGAWQLEVEKRDPFVAEIPIRLAELTPPERAWRRFKGAGGAQRAFGDALTALALRDPGDPQTVEEYLHTLCYLVGRGDPGDSVRHYDNSVQLKLAAVGPDNLEALCRWGARVSETVQRSGREAYSSSNEWRDSVPDAGYLGRRIRRAVMDLARERDKELILRMQSPQFDLLEAILEHGSIDDALPAMCAQAADGLVPEGWVAQFVAHPGPRTDAAILAQSRFGTIPAQLLAQAVGRPATTLVPAISATWRVATERTTNPAAVLQLFALGCKYGLPEMPGDLSVLISSPRPTWIQETDYEASRQTLLDVFALHCDCPRDPGLARTWLTDHGARLRFSVDTQRYELR